MQLPDIKWTYQDFEDYVLSHEAYMYDRTLYIDKDGKDVKIISDTYEEYFAKVQIKLVEASDTIKVEGIERLCDFTGGTIHAFRYWKSSPSFGVHEDPVDVLLQQCKGKKSIEIAGRMNEIFEDEFLMIPANTPHRALNDEEGLMFSYGLSDTESPTDLHKDDGDL